MIIKIHMQNGENGKKEQKLKGRVTKLHVSTWVKELQVTPK